MPALYILALFNALHNAVFGSLGNESAVAILLGSLLEQEDAVATDQELQEPAFLIQEEWSIFVLERDHA